MKVDYDKLLSLNDIYASKVYNEVKTRQRHKFNSLVAKSRSKQSNPALAPAPATVTGVRHVLNLSQRTLNDNETKVLSLGLNFALAPRKFTNS